MLVLIQPPISLDPRIRLLVGANNGESTTRSSSRTWLGLTSLTQTRQTTSRENKTYPSRNYPCQTQRKRKENRRIWPNGTKTIMQMLMTKMRTTTQIVLKKWIKQLRQSWRRSNRTTLRICLKRQLKTSWTFWRSRSATGQMSNASVRAIKAQPRNSPRIISYLVGIKIMAPILIIPYL